MSNRLPKEISRGLLSIDGNPSRLVAVPRERVVVEVVHPDGLKVTHCVLCEARALSDRFAHKPECEAAKAY